MELLLLARAEQNTSSVIQSSQPHLQWDCYYTQFTDEETETQMGEEVCSRLPGWFNERERSKWPWGFDFIFIVTPNCFLRYNLLLLVCEKMGSLFQVCISLRREKVSFFFENPEQPAEATIVGSQWILQLGIGDPVGFRVLSVAFLFCVAKTLIGKCWVCRTSLWDLVWLGGGRFPGNLLPSFLDPWAVRCGSDEGHCPGTWLHNCCGLNCPLSQSWDGDPETHYCTHEFWVWREEGCVHVCVHPSIHPSLLVHVFTCTCILLHAHTTIWKTSFLLSSQGLQCWWFQLFPAPLWWKGNDYAFCWVSVFNCRDIITTNSPWPTLF